MMKEKRSIHLGFWELLDRYQIEIPILQRDYAQGRESKESVRDNFLTAICNALSNPEGTLELDFIYGEVKGNVFKPLDGQQRLTTLFLLHWYVAHREGKLDASVQTKLGKFSYETRVSSRDFCKALVEHIASLKKESLSDSLRDCPWYYLSWDKDSTISGMLNMLDAIASKLAPMGNLWERLTQEPVPIEFSFIELCDFGLSDDLYIKMNARGKQLSDFENFKALFEKHITEKGWDAERTSEYSFSRRVDGKWSELFWKHRHIASFDSSYMRFMTLASLCDGTDEHVVQKLHNNPENFLPADMTKESYDRMYDWLEVYSSEHADKFSLPFPLWEELLPEDIPSLFTACIRDTAPSWAQLVLFFAQSEFARSYSFEGESFKDWMRVVRNIVQNTNIDSAERCMGAVRLIKELITGAEDVYQYLAGVEINSSFAKQLVKDERDKAVLIMQYPDKKGVIHRAEDTRFCQGRINFALYCAMDPVSEKINFDKLEQVTCVLQKYMDGGPTDAIRRALFTIGDGEYFKYWSSYLYAVGCPKYRLLVSRKELREFSLRHVYRDYLKQLVEMLFTKSLDDVLTEYVISNESPTWKDQLIINPDLIKSAKKKYIALDETKGICYLLPGSRVTNDKKGVAKLRKIA